MPYYGGSKKKKETRRCNQGLGLCARDSIPFVAASLSRGDTRCQQRCVVWLASYRGRAAFSYRSSQPQRKDQHLWCVKHRFRVSSFDLRRISIQRPRKETRTRGSPRYGTSATTIASHATADVVYEAEAAVSDTGGSRVEASIPDTAAASAEAAVATVSFGTVRSIIPGTVSGNVSDAGTTAIAAALDDDRCEFG